MARKVLIGRRNFVAAATLSGGSWALPLTNLKNINPQYVAESTDNSAASTTFDADLGAPHLVSAFHFSNLITSLDATLRIRAGLDNTFATTAYDIGGTPATPSHLALNVGGNLALNAGGALAINDGSGGGGSGEPIYCWPTATASAATDPWGDSTTTGIYPAEEYAALGYHRFFLPPSPILCRYIRVEIFNSGTAPLQIGVFGAWECWAPPVNISFGRSIEVIDGSEFSRLPGGSVYIVKRPAFQRHSFAFNFMTDAEFWLRALSLRLTKAADPLIVIPEPDDTNNLEKKSVYGVLSESQPFTNPYFGIWQFPFQVDQLI